MASNRGDPNKDKYLRRTVSLDPTKMSSQQTNTSTGIHINPLFEDPNEGPTDDRNSSIRRQVSEPARNKISNIVTRAESLKT